MEFGRIPGDHYAGYIEDDSDLEYSDCGEYRCVFVTTFTYSVTGLYVYTETYFYVAQDNLMFSLI